MPWQQRAQWQCGLVSRRQLNADGVDRWQVRNQVRAGSWMSVGPRVVATSTGELSGEQLLWAGYLHAGPRSAVAGLSTARSHGLRGWERPGVELLVPADLKVPELSGVTFTRTRRDIAAMRSGGIREHLLQLAPAVLLKAGEGMPERVACGLLASAVQQRLTSTAALLSWLDRLQPLPHARTFRAVLHDIEGGAQSMAEVDLGRICRRAGLQPPLRQTRRKDRDGRWRYTDAEWTLADGRVLVLEVDGAFHREFGQWSDDIRRQRKVATTRRTVVRCTALELRLEPGSVVVDLVALGVPGLRT